MTDPDRTDPFGMAPLRLPDERPVVRPARLARFVASALIMLTTAVAGLALWQSWRSYLLVIDVFSAAPTVTDAELTDADRLSTLLSWAWLGGLALSGMAFLAWLWRARINSARICDAPQRRRIRWALGSWFVPVANLWWPQMVVADVWRASRPDVPARGGDLRDVRASVLVGLWWGTFLAMHAIDQFAIHVLAEDSTVATFRAVMLANAVSGGLALVAAGSVLAVMWRIDRWQTGRVAIR
ncbi:DUF4328 domain-containing protein [Actinokineospora sp.]|uniref:DUF4328 domain-containing protein n=1 Tax=Actinokineospora sp. TaxID=1872133 RepID=UPI004037B828